MSVARAPAAKQRVENHTVYREWSVSRLVALEHSIGRLIRKSVADVIGGTDGKARLGARDWDSDTEGARTATALNRIVV